MDIFSFLGWIGSILVLAAYWLNSSKHLDATSATYQLMNLFGAIGLGINVFYQAAWPSLAVNAIWGIIALSALVKKK